MLYIILKASCIYIQLFWNAMAKYEIFTI